MISLFGESNESSFPESLPLSAETLIERLDRFYSPLEEWRDRIVVDLEGKRVKMDTAGPWITLEPSGIEHREEFRSISVPHVALDPGHIGGKWGPLEERSFAVDDGPVFQEGDAVLAISKRIQDLLKEYSIKITLVRDRSEPLNTLRPEDYLDQARAWAQQRFDGSDKPSSEIEKAIQRRADLLFYRSGEIRERARLVNEEIRPDLVVCLHINATSWDNPEKPSLKEGNDLHILVHGNYTPGELHGLEARQELAHKIAGGTFEKERVASEVFLDHFRRFTELPAYVYSGNNALKIDEAGYLWARNLAANRLYQAPVVFLEPYVANSIEGYARITAGIYEGKRMIAGKMRLSLYEEYAQAVVAALIDLFSLEKQ